MGPVTLPRSARLKGLYSFSGNLTLIFSLTFLEVMRVVLVLQVLEFAVFVSISSFLDVSKMRNYLQN